MENTNHPKAQELIQKGASPQTASIHPGQVTASDMSPAEWSADSSHEWCPPGHGDLYPAMLGTGVGNSGIRGGWVEG